MPTLVPVDHDPFVGPPEQPYVVPVNHDPFLSQSSPSLGQKLEAIGSAIFHAPTSIGQRLIDAAISGATLPHDVYYGEVDPESEEGIQRAADLASFVVGTPGTPSGALGAGAKIEGITPSSVYTRIPDEAPQSLRSRYWYELYQSAHGKNVNRIKLTPDRVQAAANLISNRASIPPISDPYLFKAHGRQAIDFAKAASAQGEKVSVKYPDGPTGSVYVRVGNRGTVRFSDHPAPMDYSTGKAVGGYSKTLRRRHGAATFSVAPYDASYEDALKWLGQSPTTKPVDYNPFTAPASGSEAS